MIEYKVNKEELHTLLKALGILKDEEQLLLVNNIELRDPSAKMISILVDTLKNAHINQTSFENLTEKELGTVLSQLYAIEQFLLKEFMQVHKHITKGQEELKKRNAGYDVNKDGIPMNVDQQMGEFLKSILNRNGSDES
ncbi:MAG: hypothetical protein ACKN9Y_00730 [Bacteroidota bacterium]|nr:hypothetical protein [bacterium]NBP63555.1 hypothetical protein [Bacteroidota bacterium]